MTEPTFSSHDWQALLKQIDGDVNILVLISGQLADGSEHYAYLSVPPGKYQAFKTAEAKGGYDASQFGTILAHGKGLTPPLHVQQELEKLYGANHRFEEELAELSRRIEKALLNEFKNPPS